MDKLFQSKWFIRVISLALAITLYVFVTLETNGTQDDSRIPLGTSNEIQVLEEVPLGIKIDSEKYVVSGVPEFVKVTLEGRMSVITPIARQLNFSVFVDLRDLDVGEHTVEVEYENLPENVTAYIEPKTIDIVIENRMAKEFPVEVELIHTDQVPLGYELGTPEVEPEIVTIISSEAVINQIAMVKVFIDVTDLKESIRNRELPISVYDIQGNYLNVRVEPSSVKASLTVERPSKKVPLVVETSGELADDLEIESIETVEEVEIFGKRDILNEINEIKTKPINLREVTKSDEYEVELDFPEGVIANNETVNVNIQLQKTIVFNDISIETRGSQGSSVTFVDPQNGKVNVAAKGSDEIIASITREQIQAYIQTNELEAGEHSLRLTVEGPRGITLNPEIERITITIP